MRYGTPNRSKIHHTTHAGVPHLSAALHTSIFTHMYTNSHPSRAATTYLTSISYFTSIGYLTSIEYLTSIIYLTSIDYLTSTCLTYYQGRIKEERACNLGNIRIHMSGGRMCPCNRFLLIECRQKM